MSSEILRKAASLMRERAEIATAAPWRAEDFPNGLAPLVIGEGKAVAETFDKPHLSDAEHIASWHPAVALAVADWLEATAEGIMHRPQTYAAALTVARAYLRESA